tara:strand:- start:11 stop:544 length:534 start_codon:yes stop_codon:yes gene_type:complete
MCDEHYWVVIDGKMKLFTFEAHIDCGVTTYIEDVFEAEIEKADGVYEFGELNDFKDYRITPSIIKEDEEEEEKIELINGKFVPVDEPMEVEEIMITTAKSLGELGTLHTGKIYFHNEETGDIYNPTEDMDEGRDADWNGHNVVYKMKNLKYIKDVEHLGETYPLYRKKTEIKFKVKK